MSDRGRKVCVGVDGRVGEGLGCPFTVLVVAPAVPWLLVVLHPSDLSILYGLLYTSLLGVVCRGLFGYADSVKAVHNTHYDRVMECLSYVDF